MVLFRIRRGNCANQFDESGGYAQNQSNQIKPSSMQPTIEPRADQPAGKGCRGKRKRKLAIACDQYPEVSLLFGSIVVRHELIVTLPSQLQARPASILTTSSRLQ